MKRNRHRLSRFVSARTFWVRAVAAWRELLPDWKPTLEMLQALDNMPINHQRAVRVVAHGWDYNDPRWDVLMALLEWERRDTKARVYADQLTRMGQEMGYITDVPASVWDCMKTEEESSEDLHEGPLREDHSTGLAERTLPNLRQVQPPPEDVHADPEPVQPEREPADEEREGDPEGADGPGERLVKPPKRVLSLREAKAAYAPRDDDGDGE